MAAPIKPIETEKEYEENLSRLISAADKIENFHPLDNAELLHKYRNAYDRIAGYIDHYKIREFARMFPYLRPFYEEQGRIGKGEVFD